MSNYLKSQEQWEIEAEDALLQMWHDDTTDCTTLKQFKKAMYKLYTESWVDIYGDDDD